MANKEHPRFRRAFARTDLSQLLVHFIRLLSEVGSGDSLFCSQALINILREGRVRASKVGHIFKYCQEGASCFYDAPPNIWPEILATNPSSRIYACGLVVSREALWQLGGRPVIYTENSNPDYWPEMERYRVVYTDLSRVPQPVDWTHEREWRLRGDLWLNAQGFTTPWWWPVVPTEEFAQVIYDSFPGIHTVYVFDHQMFKTRS